MEAGYVSSSEPLPVNGLMLGNQNDGSGDYWIAVANTEYGRIPGKAQPGVCYYSYNGDECSTEDFEWVTYPNTMITIPNTGTGPPPGTRPIGHQNDGRGDQYAVIADTEWGRIAGKACADTDCWYAYGGAEYETAAFEWVTCTRVTDPYHEKMDIEFVHASQGCPEHGLKFGFQNDGRGEHCVAVADTEHGKIPGKAEDGTCWYSYNGEEQTTDDFHYVAHSSPHSFIPNNMGGPPPDATPVGYQDDGRGDQYAVIANTEWGRIPGKACESGNGVCWYPYGGKEYETSDFEWVVFAPPRDE